MHVTFTGLLFLLFLGLKLTGYIAWSWVWVTAPLWMPMMLVLFIFAVLGVVAVATDKALMYAKKK